MPPARRPEFEPAYGARATDVPLAPPGRDRPADAMPAALMGGPDVGASGDVTRVEPRQPAPRQPGVADEPMIDSDRRGDSGASTEASARPAPTDIAAEQTPFDPVPTGSVATGPVLPARPPVDPTPVGCDVPPMPEPVDPTPIDAGPVPPGRVGNRWFRVRRRILAACAIAVVLGVGYYLVSLAQVWTTGRADDVGPVDAIVVMGAAQYDGRPSPQLAARLDHVVELWPQGVAPLVVVTGGNIPGDRFTEAEASAAYLAERGVPEDVLLLENDGSNSYESLEAVADLLAARGLDEVLIVTDPYHALRSRLIAEEVGLDASTSSTDSSVVTGGESLTRHLQEAGGVAVGRVIGFDRLTRLVG
jgi:uncharacterized SAM-binding protein YcdF (DUF218 family)